MEVEKKYKWMEMLEGGLLKEPDDLESCSCTTTFNGWDGFDSEEEALKRWKELKDLHEFEVPNTLILLPFYRLT